MPVTLPPTPLATQADLDALAARVAALEHQAPPATKPSATGHYISKPTDPPIIDDSLNAWCLVAGTGTSGQQIAVEGAMSPPPPIVDPVTANVVRLGIDLVGGFRRVVQQNAAGSWYSTPAPSSGWTQIAGPDGPAPAPGTIYRVSGGRILTPAGQPFRARGVNVLSARVWGDKGWEFSRVTRARLQQSLPGINFVRFACWAGFLPSATDQNWINWIGDLTGHGIVVEVDLHYTGNAVAPGDAAANGWLASFASIWKDNPLVWFGTQNEPHGAGTAISAMMLGQYRAIRGAGSPNPIMLCTGDPGAEITGMSQADIGQMTGVAFDTHCYGWLLPQWGSIISSLGAFHSADGAIPVLVLETGNGATSDAIDGNWQDVFNTAKANPAGAAWWLINWSDSQPADCIWAAPFDGSVVQSPYGQMVAQAIASTA